MSEYDVKGDEDFCCCNTCLSQRATDKALTPDDVTAPTHYVDGRKYEPHLVIEDWGLNHNLGSVLKYIARYLLKGNPVKDLRKARQYLDFEIERLEKE